MKFSRVSRRCDGIADEIGAIWWASMGSGRGAAIGVRIQMVSCELWVLACGSAGSGGGDLRSGDGGAGGPRPNIRGDGGKRGRGRRPGFVWLEN